MYPAQTSFIPIQVALVRWLEAEGWRGVIGSNYPYWYLGTTPYRHLTGPVMPGLMISLGRLVPNWNWFEVMWLVMAVFWLLGIAGVYWLVRELGGGKRVSGLSAWFYGLGWFTAWSFPAADGLSLVSFSMLIYVMAGYVKWLKEKSLKRVISLGISIGFVLLLNSLIVPSLVLGMIVILLSSGRWKQVDQRLKETVKLLLIGWLIATLWYGVGYWWWLLVGPSFAGKPTFQVIGQVTKLMPMVLGLGLAVVGGRWLKLKSRLSRFIFYWLSIFGFLTLLRFISDPDFVMDWLAYGLELQLGLGLGMALWLVRKKQGVKRVLKPVLVGLWLGIWVFLVRNKVVGSVRQEVAESVERRIAGVLSWVVQPDEKVFLSGSSVFWLNSWFDIAQVRGGADRGSVDPDWRAAAWEIREGKEVIRSLEWIDKLGIKWLVVHGKTSREVYGDFKFPDKFEGVKRLEKVYDMNGDRIYKVKS